MDGSLNGPFDQGHTGTCSFQTQLECPRDHQFNAMILTAGVKQRWFPVWFLNAICRCNRVSSMDKGANNLEVQR